MMIISNHTQIQNEKLLKFGKEQLTSIFTFYNINAHNYYK